MDCIFGIITLVRAVANVLGSILYNVLRTAGSMLLRTVLLPFFGPFAWIVTLLIDVGIDIINWFVDLKSKVSDFVEWVIKQDFSTLINLVKALKKLC